MRRCVRCPGFVPEAALACPNCDAAPRGQWWTRAVATRGALAGTAAMTLMACYGAPVDWLLSETDSGESTLLDADNATVTGEIEFTINQAALSEAVSDTAEVSLTITPLEADTEVLVTSTINGATMEASHSATGSEPIAIVLPADSFSECSDDVCTQTISFSLQLVAGRAVYEGAASIEVYGVDQTMPENAEATVTWTP